jgi:hypothetical protein
LIHGKKAWQELKKAREEAAKARKGEGLGAQVKRKKRKVEALEPLEEEVSTEPKVNGLLERYDPNGELAKSLEKVLEEEIETQRKEEEINQRSWYFRTLGSRWIADVVNEYLEEQLERNNEGKPFHSTEELADYIREEHGEDFLDILNSYAERKNKANGKS